MTWEGNLRLYLRFQDRTAWLTRPWHRVRLLVGLDLPVHDSVHGLGAVGGGRCSSSDPNATWRSIAMAVITIVAAVTFITHIYETLFLVTRVGERSHARRALAAAQRRGGAAGAQERGQSAHALQQPQRAQPPRRAASSARIGVCRALAGSYRYLLRSGSKRLVPLADELGPARPVPLARDHPLCRRPDRCGARDAHAANAGRFHRSYCRNCSKMQSSTTSSRPITLWRSRSAWRGPTDRLP